MTCAADCLKVLHQAASLGRSLCLSRVTHLPISIVGDPGKWRLHWNSAGQHVKAVLATDRSLTGGSTDPAAQIVRGRVTFQ
ncbi:hypothetical protein GCM10023323_44500 [Streptomyces thinghirensis]|uniref:Uncharacterized protein n=1 Tax=Streptomyces thinghirensis TaxID=551547 RepID=A0ABP9T874_9ACTN